MKRTALLAAALAVAVLSGCAGIREALSPPPQGKPSGREGWLVYGVGALRFEAPAAWQPTGSARHLKLENPGATARLEVSTPETTYADQKACLAAAEEVLAKASSLERVRRHETTFGGARALTLEGDSGGWHVWAWAACDGGTQYQVFFTAQTPAPAPVIEAYRTLTSTARIGGEV
ncbi:hypothetical protein [Anaeromyxobacter oryzae]|uniref:Lipoprotein n=1 Tax=Anaeromyxobacter oryzae TaxID=2918170 RepID=A0ABM7X3G4_9BACT|nr:hypothetical protein [Anaeromyxobacter oryzae]BDG06333.1 hypothetical protein AMOR_53290 [Anaeromyxobacter oryzae]